MARHEVLEDGTRLLTTGDVAAIFRVAPHTVTRWANGGLLDFILTPGGRRRYREPEVLTLLAGGVGTHG